MTLAAPGSLNSGIDEQENYVSSVQSRDGTTIAFDRSGEGPPVILVGGALQHRAMDPQTAQLAALLAPSFTVFHYDRRGRGDSGDTAPYAVAREVEDIEALIDEAGGSAFLYGMSSGGALALEAAAKHGLAVTKLALYEAPFMVDDSRPRPPEDWATRIGELAASDRRGDAVELFLTEGPGVPAEMVAQMRSTPVWPALESVAHTIPYDLTIMGDESLLAERVPSVAVPTLVIDGGASPAWMHNAADAVANALPNAQRRTLEGQTHEVSPEALAPVLEEFFAGVRVA
jgi:pimeloyl-ACP methyl ester carboxylesterase